MFSRMFSLAIVSILAGHASAEFLVQDGDFYSELEVTEDFLMTGGVLAGPTFDGDINAAIEAGQVGISGGHNRIKMIEGVQLTIRGGKFLGLDEKNFVQIDGSNTWNGLGDAVEPSITIEARYMRVRSQSLGQWRLQGWLADGNWFNLNYINRGNFLGSSVNIVLVPGTIPLVAGDTDGDHDVDLEDLNNVRNHFGSNGLGDSNQDGSVDLDDLNLVRNNFGNKSPFILTPDEAVTQSGTVPEPSSLLLVSVALAGIAYRRRSCWRSSSPS